MFDSNALVTEAVLDHPYWSSEDFKLLASNPHLHCPRCYGEVDAGECVECGYYLYGDHED